jgi:hypothetical protein
LKPGGFLKMNAVIQHVGRCMTKGCGKPAAYAQLLPSSRRFLYCEEHVPAIVKKAAESKEAEMKNR